MERNIIELLTEIRDILNREIPDLNIRRVKMVCLGLGYSGVQLESGHMGVCNTSLSEVILECCQIIKNAGTLAGRTAKELMDFVDSWDIIERVIGVSTINALSQLVIEANPKRYLIEEDNLIDVIEISSADTVVMVGHIKPFESAFRSKAKDVIILERSSRREEGVLPDTACEMVIPNADVVVITGSALVNGTIDRLLELSSKARTVALVGPTVSCLPDPLFRRGVDYIGGLRIDDSDKAMKILSEGGGTPQLRKAGKFVTFKVS